MNKTRFTTRFNRKKRLDKNGKGTVQIECYLNGKRKYFDTQIRIEPIFWDTKRNIVNLNYPNAVKLNKHIAEMIREFENYELDKLNANKSFNLSMLENVFKTPAAKTFNEFMQTEIKNANIEVGTRKSHTSTLNRLNEFRKNIAFEDLTFEFMHDFDRYCRTKCFIYEKDKQPRNLSENTIWKYFKNIKTYVNLAINKELMSIEQYPFRKFKAKQVETEKVYLTPDEIEQIENCNLTGDFKKYQYIKDLFLFSVYTGLRYSDVMSLEKKNIVSISGNDWLIKDMEKTNEKVRIPIYAIFNGKPTEIITKYWNANRFECFEYMTNQHINRALKIISEVAGISKNITFHVARHTTATYLLYKGANMASVQKILGHKKITTTQIYGHIMDMTIENDMKAINF